jgi:crotonobetainyl-CoA:carnitine CoA-transferase CaiB-like acyl-CoA transferase
MNAVLTAKTTDHWVAALEAAGVPCGPVYDYAQLFAGPQVHHHGLVQYAKDGELGEVPLIGAPVKIGQGVRVRTVAPKLGQDNAEIYGGLGVNEAELKELRAKSVL